MRRLPSVNALRFFDSAARQLSFSRAAKELFVTHSAVSQQIRQLEEWFGCPLFERERGGVRLTEAGVNLQYATDQAFSLLESRCDELKRSTAPAGLILGAPASFITNWLISRLGRFESENPQINIRLQTAEDAELVVTQRIDALIKADTSWPVGIEATPLFSERVGPVCMPCMAKSVQTASDVMTQPLLQTASRKCAWDAWALAQDLDYLKLPIRREFDHLGHTLEAAIAGLGIAIAPESLVKPDILAGRLVAPLGFMESGAVFSVGMFKTRITPSLALLRDWLVREAQATD